MLRTGLSPEVRLPRTAPRPWGRFVDTVPNVSSELVVDGASRITLGASWMSPNAMSPIVTAFDCETDDDKTGNVALEPVTQSPFLSFNLLECSTLSGDLTPLAELLFDTFRATVSEALAFAATTTTLTSDHLNLNDDSVNLGAGTSIVETIAMVEYGLSQVVSNQQGHVFISPRYLAPATSAGVIRLVDGNLLTPAGHLVISDAGHQTPGNVYGVSGLAYAISDVLELSGREGTMDYARNVKTWLAENWGLVLFPPDHAVKASLLGAVS